MKKTLLALFALYLALLACDLSLLEPTANISAVISPTEQVLPSPIPTITTEPTVTASTTPAPITCTVTAAKALHLRDAPNIEGNVIAWLVNGDQLTLLPDPPVGVWVNITTADSLTGWVNSLFCEVTL